MSSTLEKRQLPGSVSSLAATSAADGAGSSLNLWSVGPLGFVLVLLVMATAFSGAFEISRWAPPTLFVLVLLLTILVRGGRLWFPDVGLRVALAGAWGWAAWAALSATWAASPATALEGAGRQALYAAILTLPLVATRSRRVLAIAGDGAVAGICLIALYILIKLISDGPSVYLAGRLNDPIGYRNATALLFSLAFWPLIVRAATRSQGRLLRSGAFSLAVLMLGLTFLTQSRGVLLGLGCGAVVVLAFGPDRIRRMWLALLGVLMIAAFAHWLLRPYHAFGGGDGNVTGHDIAVAGWGLLAAMLLGGALMGLLAVFDRGLRPHGPAADTVTFIARAGFVLAIVVGVTGALIAIGNPVDKFNSEWAQFKSLETTSTSATRYTSAGGQRYDLWRVALDEFQKHPLVGVGQGSYEIDYYRDRRSDRNLDDPHGLLFQVGAELGLVGLAFCLMIPLGLLFTMSRRWRGTPDGIRRPAAGLAAAGVTFIGQSLVDWMFRIPGMTTIGLLCLVLAAALVAQGSEVQAEQSIPERNPLPKGLRVALGAGLALASLMVLCLYLSDFYANRARSEAGRSPQSELANARTAGRLDPFSLRPRYLEASAYESEGDRSAALSELQAAAKREPEDFAPIALIGDFYARAGQFAKARVYYRRALWMDPLDSGLQQLAKTGGQLSR